MVCICRQQEAAPYTPTSVAVSATADLVAVGADDKKIHFYRLAVDGTLTAAFETREAGMRAGTPVIAALFTFLPLSRNLLAACLLAPLCAYLHVHHAAGAVSAVAFSPDGALLAAGDALRDVRLYNTADGACLNSGKWVSHTTRVTGIAWSASGEVCWSTWLTLRSSVCVCAPVWLRVRMRCLLACP